MPNYSNQRAVAIENTCKAFRDRHDLGSLANIYYGQRKYDGCQGIVLTSSKQMISRTGKQVLSCDHIIKQVVDLFGPGWVVFGEVWMTRTEFAVIGGKFRAHSPCSELSFVLYDVVTEQAFNGTDDDPATYRERLHHIEALLEMSSFFDTRALMVASTYNPGTYGHPQVAANALVQLKHDEHNGNHFDGMILRDPDAPWLMGDAKNGALIKVKPHLSFTLRVVGFDMAVGAKTGRPTAALLCAFKGGRVLRVGSGLDHASQADPGPLVGKLVEVEATEYSSDGLLREPRFKGIRDDVTTADF